MKTMLLFSLCLAAVTVSAGAQDDVQSPPSHAPAKEVKPQNAFPIRRNPEPPARTVSGAVSGDLSSLRLGQTYTRAGAPVLEGKSLIIRSSETDPKSLSEAQEDMAIMARILGKTIPSRVDDGEKRAMGIVINMTPGGAAARYLQIEGYGAVFTMTVNFPLAGSKENAVAEKPAEPTNSTWEAAKQEVFGSPSPAARTVASTAPKVEYDPKRVEALKDSLLEALKNAANIRSLKADESVTVVVSCGQDMIVPPPSLSVGELATADGHGHNYFLGAVRFPPPPFAASTLTIRAKKPDIDAFFKGRLNLDEFRKKVSMVIY